VKYKLFDQEVFGLGLVDTGNLVQSTLISKEYFDLLGLNLVESSEYFVGTADKSSAGLRILGRSEHVKILLDGIDQTITLNPTAVDGLSHPLNLGLGFMEENELSLRCNKEGARIVKGKSEGSQQTHLVEGSRQPSPFYSQVREMLSFMCMLWAPVLLQGVVQKPKGASVVFTHEILFWSTPPPSPDEPSAPPPRSSTEKIRRPPYPPLIRALDPIEIIQRRE